MNANIFVFVNCVRAIIYLSLYKDQGGEQAIIRKAKNSGDIINFADSSSSLRKCCLRR